MLLKGFLLQFFGVGVRGWGWGCGIKVGVSWIPCHSSVNDGMHMIQTWIFCLAKQVLDFSKLIDD